MSEGIPSSMGFGFAITAKNESHGPVTQSIREAAALGKQLRATAEEAKKGVPAFTGLAKAETGLAKAAHALATDAEKGVRVTADLGKGMDKGAAAAGGMRGKMLALVAAIASYIGFRAVKAGFLSLIESGDQAEQQIVRLTARLVTHAKAMDAYKWAQKSAADSTGFSGEAVAGAYETMLSQMGGSEEKVRSKMKVVMGIATLGQKDLKETATGINSAMMGVRLSSFAREFGINVEQIKAAVKGLTAGGEAYKAAMWKFLETNPGIMNAQKLMAESLRGAKSGLSNLVSDLKMAIVGVGGGDGKVLDTWTKFLFNIVEKFKSVKDKIAVFMSEVGQVISQAILIVHKAFNSLFSVVKEWIDSTGSAVNRQQTIILPFLLWLELTYFKVKRVVLAFVDGFKRGWEQAKPFMDALQNMFSPESGSQSGAEGLANALGRIVGILAQMVTNINLLFAPIKGLLDLADKYGLVAEEAGTAVQGIIGTGYDQRGRIEEQKKLAKQNAIDDIYNTPNLSYEEIKKREKAINTNPIYNPLATMEPVKAGISDESKRNFWSGAKTVGKASMLINPATLIPASYMWGGELKDKAMGAIQSPVGEGITSTFEAMNPFGLGSAASLMRSLFGERGSKVSSDIDTGTTGKMVSTYAGASIAAADNSINANIANINIYAPDGVTYDTLSANIEVMSKDMSVQTLEAIKSQQALDNARKGLNKK